MPRHEERRPGPERPAGSEAPGGHELPGGHAAPGGPVPPAGTEVAARHLALVGPTASGKSALAMALARRRPDLEIVSVDSMQVYRGMDIGTAKPTPSDRAEVRHHLLDVCDPDDDYTVARFQADCRAALGDIESRGRRALLVGGTGLYLQAVTDDLEIPGRWPEVRHQLEAEPRTEVLFERLSDLDPLAAGRMEPSNRRRVVRALEVTIGSGRPFSTFGPGIDAYPPLPFPVVALDVPRPVLDQRIEARYATQLDQGFLAEVASLLSRPAGLSRTARQALGYTELIDHLEHATPLDAAVATAVRRTRRFARRQERWFRRDPRVRWVPVDHGAGAAPVARDDVGRSRDPAGSGGPAAADAPDLAAPDPGALDRIEALMG